MPRAFSSSVSQKAEEAALRLKALEALEFVGLRGKEFAEAKSLPYGRQRSSSWRGPSSPIRNSSSSMSLRPDSNAAETEALVELLFQIRDRGITILLVEHDMSLVMNVSDHITVLNFGKKIAEGSADEVEHNQEVIDAYLGWRWAMEWPMMLNVKEIETWYGAIQALKGISLDVNQGEIVALLGANGAGKTTTLKTITGLLDACQGPD